MEIMTYVFAFAIFACIGSFIGVCADRIPEGKQVAKGRSHCDGCGKMLSGLELIPIVSYLCLGGRCKRCRVRIPVFCILLELTTALLATLAIYIFGLNAKGIAYSIVTCVLIEIAILDQKTMEISDIANLMIAVAGLVLMFLNGSYLPSMIGMVCVSVPFLVLTKLKAMGMGDVKLMAAVGLLLGYQGVLLAAFLGIVIGSAAAAFMKISKNKDWKSEIPFGPYLCIGSYIAMLWGDRILSLYLSLL